MPVENTESLSAEQLQLETLFLGLRTKHGIDIKNYQTRFGVDLFSVKGAIIDRLIRNNILELKNGFLCPTEQGLAIADSLALI